MAGDWNGDGKADVGVYRNTAHGGEWPTVKIGRPAPSSRTFGRPGDVPFVGDWDGNGSTELGVQPARAARPWALRNATGRAVYVSGLGAAADIPVTGDWDGNGRSDLGCYRSSTHTFYAAVADGHAHRGPVGRDGRPARHRGLERRPAHRPRGVQPDDADVDPPGPVGRRLRHQAPCVYGVGRRHAGHRRLERRPVTDLGVWRPSTGRFYLRTVPRPAG